MNKKMPSYKAWLLVISGLIVIIGALSLYKLKQIKSAIDTANSFPEHYEVVDVAYVKNAEHMPTISVLGVAHSPYQSELFTELSGKMAVIGVQPGEAAKRGELLFQLDISEQKARIKSAKAREIHATSVVNRYKKLLGKNAISQEQYDQAYADLIVIQSEIDVLKSTIAQKTVRAPFDGMMGLNNIKLGDYVSANKMLANYVGISDKIWVEFSVPQFYPELPLHSKVRVRNIDALGTASFQSAEIVAKDTQISNTTRSLKYRAEISRAVAQYTPNMPLEILIPISGNQNVFLVPTTSVNQDLYGAYILKLIQNENNPDSYRAKRIAVKVVSQSSTEKMIVNGVQAGDKIAAAGAFKLYDGILVHVKESNPTPSLLADTKEK